MHIHTLKLDIPRSKAVSCEGCSIKLRLATGDESRFVVDTGTFGEDGPMIGPLNTVVVPEDFSLFKEEA